MTNFHSQLAASRRHFLRGLGLVTGALVFNAQTRALFAEELLATPNVTEGPFYPDKMPLDTDNDLIIVNNSITPALGEITHLSGRVRTVTGAPVRNAEVEIWQVDSHGIYLNSHDQHAAGQRDANFQGYGRFLTDASGAYYFRTIKPVPYPGRTPHIHFAISKNGKRIYTTQMLIRGFPQNTHDGVFMGVRDARQRDLLLADFRPLPDSKIGELSANFDIVLGATPKDADDGHVHGGIGPAQGMGFGGPGGPGGPHGPGGPPPFGPDGPPPFDGPPPGY